MKRAVFLWTLVGATMFCGAVTAQSGGPSPAQGLPSTTSPQTAQPARRPSVLAARRPDGLHAHRRGCAWRGLRLLPRGTRGNTPATQPVTTAGRQRVEVAREMFLMVDWLNASVQEATGKPASEVTRVTCATCHRGVPIPMQIADIMWQTSMKQGAEAAVAQYRDLRSRFYGRQAYDFGEDALIRCLRAARQRAA